MSNIKITINKKEEKESKMRKEVPFGLIEDQENQILKSGEEVKRGKNVSKALINRIPRQLAVGLSAKNPTNVIASVVEFRNFGT